MTKKGLQWPGLCSTTAKYLTNASLSLVFDSLHIEKAIVIALDWPPLEYATYTQHQQGTHVEAMLGAIELLGPQQTSLVVEAIIEMLNDSLLLHAKPEIVFKMKPKACKSTHPRLVTTIQCVFKTKTSKFASLNSAGMYCNRTGQESDSSMVAHNQMWFAKSPTAKPVEAGASGVHSVSDRQIPAYVVEASPQRPKSHLGSSRLEGQG